jgi:hypothetical protein
LYVVRVGAQRAELHGVFRFDLIEFAGQYLDELRLVQAGWLHCSADGDAALAGKVSHGLGMDGRGGDQEGEERKQGSHELRMVSGGRIQWWMETKPGLQTYN